MKCNAVIVFSVLSVIAGCADATTEPGVEINTGGALAAVAYVDRNDNNVFDADEAPLAGVPVVLLRGTADTVMRRVTTAAGVAEFRNVTIGTYRVAVAPSPATDSLTASVSNIREITVAANDTVETVIAFVYPGVTIRALRQLAPGKRVQLRATALHGWSSFGDSTVHVSDSTGTLRVVGVEPSVFGAGDVVRLVGTSALVNDKPTLRDVRVSVVTFGSSPKPVAVTTATASTAGNGAMDAALVRITNASVVGWVTTGGDVIVSANDGSGRVDVVMDRDAAIDLSRLERGASLNTTGILVPARSGGGWQLKPRASADVELTLPQLTVTAARAAEIGRRVRIKGAALHSWASFADGSLHLKDATGTIRITGVPAVSVFAGDTVEVTGFIAAEAGQPVLREAIAEVMAIGNSPAPEAATLAAAANAGSGRLDAALVRLPSAEVTDTITLGRDYGLALTAGSDTIRVVLDADAGFAPGQYEMGARLEITGVLIPNATGRQWIIKPRSRNDVR